MAAHPRARNLAIKLTALALICDPVMVLAQQPTLRYSRQAARPVAARLPANEGEPVDDESKAAIGTGVHRRVERAAFQSPPGRRGGLPPGYRAAHRQPGAMHDAEELTEEVMDSTVAGQRIVLDESASDAYLGPHGHSHPGSDCASCGYSGYGRVYGGDPACGACGPECCLPCLRLDNVELFAGAHGFTGPNNRGSGSFGFHEGINAGMPFICGLAIQGGYQATQSNFEGTFFTPDDRTQSFVTVGAFRRVDLGLQGGVVVDYLNDQWDCDISLAQIRGELSWRMPCDHEFGFWFASGLDQSTISARDVQFPVPSAGNDTIVVSDGTFDVEPLDIYAFFYRKQFTCGGEGRAWGGFTDDSRGLLGGNIRLPVSTCLSFSTDFLYIIPAESSQTGFAEEAWNVSFNLVWTPCRRNQCGPNYCRPLFDVANNGSFVVRMR